MCAGNRLLVLEENFGHVVECGCGTLHVGVGPVSLALDLRSLEKLHEMLGAALARIASPSDEVESPVGTLVHGSHFELRKVMRLKH
jgi:hypothetical protein